VTGKGSEQTMIVKGRAEPWNDAAIIFEELRALGYRAERTLI